MHWRMRPLVLSPVCASQPSDRIHFNCHGHHLPNRMDTSLPTRSRTSLHPSEFDANETKKSSSYPVTNLRKTSNQKMYIGACAKKFVSNHAQSPPIGHPSFSRDYNLIHDTGMIIHIIHCLFLSFSLYLNRIYNRVGVAAKTTMAGERVAQEAQTEQSVPTAAPTYTRSRHFNFPYIFPIFHVVVEETTESEAAVSWQAPPCLQTHGEITEYEFEAVPLDK